MENWWLSCSWRKCPRLLLNPLPFQLKKPYGKEGKHHSAEKDAAEEDFLMENIRSTRAPAAPNMKVRTGLGAVNGGTTRPNVSTMLGG